MEKLYTTKEVGEALGVTSQAVRAWIKAGRVKAIITPTGYAKITESELQRLLLNSTSEGKGK